MMTDYVIEMDDLNYFGYGVIHKAGCQHVKDPMPVDNDDPDESTGWGFPSAEYHRAPCVK